MISARRSFALRSLAAVHGLGAALVIWAPVHASAQTGTNSATAQALFDEAKRLMAEKRFTEACPKLEESQRLDGGSGTLLNLARCYEQVGRLASAWGTYIEAASQARAAGNSARETAARDFANALAPRLSRLEIKVAPEARIEGLEIRRNGTIIGAAQWGLALPVDPGEHVIVASAPGHASWQQHVKAAAEGKTSAVEVPKLGDQATAAPATVAAAPDAPPPEPSTQTQESGWPAQRTYALIAGGVGVAGVAVGTIFGLRSLSHHNEAEKTCSGDTCLTQGGLDASNDARAAGTWSTVGFIVGGAGLALGSVLWFTAPAGSRHEQAHVRLGVGPLSLHVSGSY